MLRLQDRCCAVQNRALELGRRTNNATVTALSLVGLARIALRTDVEAARRLCREAMAVTEGTGDRTGRSHAMHVLAVAAQMAGDLPEAVAAHQGELERAATLIGAADGAMEAAGGAWPPDERVHYDGTVATITGAMEPAELEGARARGRAMSALEAVHFALRAASAG